MKKILSVAFAVAGLVLANSAFAADDAKSVTVTGEGQCLKCALKKADSCQNAIVAKVDGKEVTYILAQNEVSKSFHKNVCSKKAKVKAIGKVKEEDGKKILTAEKIELVPQDS